MYQPAHFREDRIGILRQLVQQHPLATLVTLGPDGLLANHIPLLWDPDPAPYGTLRGHVARANSQWRESRSDVSALAIFLGPSAYISPSWYAAKQEHGRVVPTYNYAVVHAEGPLVTFEDPERLGAVVSALTDAQESGFAQPWSASDAPPNFIEGMLRAIVGIEIPIARLEGKWKVSQNRDAADRAKVSAGLREMATLVDPVSEG